MPGTGNLKTSRRVTTNLKKMMGYVILMLNLTTILISSDLMSSENSANPTSYESYNNLSSQRIFDMIFLEALPFAIILVSFVAKI